MTAVNPLPDDPSTAGSAYDRWAWLYDGLYESRYGSMYRAMTDEHLAAIEPYLAGGNGGLLDVGAGSGRIAVPAAERGIPVTAIDPSRGMLERLETKARGAGVRDRIAIVRRAIEAISTADRIRSDHDAALCAFSTIHHLIEPGSLHEAFRSIASGLRFDGVALVGVHPGRIFRIYREGVTEDVHLPPLGGKVRWSQSLHHLKGKYPVFECRNNLLLPDGHTIEDRFPFRPWSIDEIIAASRGSGLEPDGVEGSIGDEDLLRFRRKR